MGLSAILWIGCGGAPRAAAEPAMAAAEAPAMAEAPSARAASEQGFSDVNTDRRLNTSSYVRAWSDDLLGTASRFRRELYRLQGHVISERIDYEDRLRVRTHKLPQRAPKQERGLAIFEVSVPIESLPELLDWLRIHTIIVEQYVVATRDPALLAPAAEATQQHQRAQLEQRLAQLEQRIAQASEAERPALEAERANLQSTLAQLQAAAPPVPEVRLATLAVRFEADLPQIRFASASLVPNLRASLLVTDALAQGNARDVRVGVAMGVGLPLFNRGGMIPSPLIELAGYPSTDEHDAGVSVTVGSALYARSLGGGERTWLNPFAGFRLGYAYLDTHLFALSGELGVELLKTNGVAVSTSIRPYGMLGEDSQVALEAGASLLFAF